MRPLIVDSFAGGGGASTGIEMALGRSPDIAINHDEDALAMHAINHPDTLHLSKNIWTIDPLDYVRGRPVDLAWFSPDCKHHSKAKGGRPVKRNIRDLAWVVVTWAKRARPRVIALENVEEFKDWGPVIPNDKGEFYPCPDRKGQTFRKFVTELRRLGYKVQWRELKACDYGAPTIRKRLFMIARRDDEPIVWPKPTHGAPDSPAVQAGELLPWHTAAEVIDWSLPCPSIFDTRQEIMDKWGLVANRPLKPNTMARVAKGVKRYVLDAADPFIVHVQNASNPNGTNSLHDPLRTVTAHPKGGGMALVSPTLIQTGYGERPGQEPRVPGLEKPLGTVVAGGSKHALVAAFMAQHNSGVIGHPVVKPLSTVTLRGTQQQLVAAHMMNMKGSERSSRSIEEPLSALTAGGSHAAHVCAFLTKYYGTAQHPALRHPFHTVTTKDRFSLVTVNIAGDPYVIYDIGMRMLTPRELFRAQGFPDSYIIDRGSYDGYEVKMTKTASIKMCGNSVCPPLAEAIVRANCAFLIEGRVAA